jgi:hypothetical protein
MPVIVQRAVQSTCAIHQVFGSEKEFKFRFSYICMPYKRTKKRVRLLSSSKRVDDFFCGLFFFLANYNKNTLLPSFFTICSYSCMHMLVSPVNHIKIFSRKKKTVFNKKRKKNNEREKNPQRKSVPYKRRHFDHFFTTINPIIPNRLYFAQEIWVIKSQQ